MPEDVLTLERKCSESQMSSWFVDPAICAFHQLGVEMEIFIFSTHSASQRARLSRCCCKCDDSRKQLIVTEYGLI